MKKTFLITGGAGFIGSFLVDKLVSFGHEVIIYDSLDPQVHDEKKPEYLNENAHLVKGDMLDYNQLAENVRASDIVVNFAAKVGIGQSMYKIKDYVGTNELGTANLLHALVNENHSVKKLIVASSMCIYGEGSYRCEKCGISFHDAIRNHDLARKGNWNIRCNFCNNELTPVPTKESKPVSNDRIYAITKKNQEEMSLSIGKAYGIPTTALRFSNVYGPRQSLNNPYTGVTAIFMSQIKNNNSPLIFEDGLQSRDFISVHDIVDANLLAINNRSSDYEAFNVGTGKPTSIINIAQTFIEILNHDLKPKITFEYRKGDIRHCFADISKIKSKLDFEPKISLRHGMKELVEWSKKQEAFDGTKKAYQELKEKRLI